MLVYQRDNSTKPYNLDIMVYDDFRYILHLHKDFEFVHIIEGGIIMNIDGREEELREGESALILCNQVHGFSTPEHSKVFVGVFAADYVRDFASLVSGKSTVSNRFRLDRTDIDFIDAKFICADRTDDRLMLTACLNVICSAFLSSAVLGDAGKKNDSDRGSELLRDMLGYICGHYTEDVTLSGMAHELGYEKHYLSRCFHSCFGRNFKQFVNEYRVDAAKELISSHRGDPGFNLTDIAYLCGFQSVRNFNRAYKNITGQCPSGAKKM